MPYANGYIGVCDDDDDELRVEEMLRAGLPDVQDFRSDGKGMGDNSRVVIVVVVGVVVMVSCIGAQRSRER
jgi:hypothetical protein